MLIEQKQLQLNPFVERHLNKLWMKNYKSGTFGHHASKHIAIFLKPDGKILNTSNGHVLFGINKPKTHSMMKNFVRSKPFVESHDVGESMFLHAEIDLLTKCVQSWRTDDLNDLTMWVARFRINDSLKLIEANSKPCLGCQSKLTKFNVSKCFHT